MEVFVKTFDPSNHHCLPIFHMALTFDDEKMEICPTPRDLEAAVLQMLNVITGTLQVRLPPHATSIYVKMPCLTELDICDIDPHNIQTVQWRLTQPSSALDATLPDQILEWAQATVRDAVREHLQHPDQHFQSYGDVPLSNHFTCYSKCIVSFKC